jgi:hypothetical protein
MEILQFHQLWTARGLLGQGPCTETYREDGSGHAGAEGELIAYCSHNHQYHLHHFNKKPSRLTNTDRGGALITQRCYL